MAIVQDVRKNSFPSGYTSPGPAIGLYFVDGRGAGRKGWTHTCMSCPVLHVCIDLHMAGTDRQTDRRQAIVVGVLA